MLNMNYDRGKNNIRISTTVAGCIYKNIKRSPRSPEPSNPFTRKSPVCKQMEYFKLHRRRTERRCFISGMLFVANEIIPETSRFRENNQ